MNIKIHCRSSFSSLKMYGFHWLSIRPLNLLTSSFSWCWLRMIDWIFYLVTLMIRPCSLTWCMATAQALESFENSQIECNLTIFGVMVATIVLIRYLASVKWKAVFAPRSIVNGNWKTSCWFMEPCYWFGDAKKRWKQPLIHLHWGSHFLKGTCN